MFKKLTNVLLILTVASSVAAGMPLHSNEQECSMTEMSGMDCCKKAVQAESVAPEVSSARLCCALDCSQSGTTGSTVSRLPRPSTSQALAIPPSSAQPLVPLPHLSSSSTWGNSPPPYSNPAYIRHLALLI
jgi:hypothetical protein